jgi:DNA-binding NtrC family response regulator
LQASDVVLRERAHLRSEAQTTRKEIADEWSFRRFVGMSAAVRKLEEEVRRAARADFTVLLLGESGTGKSILARILHHSSPRGENTFVTVSAPNLPAEMVESELFGHVKGAFTGAVQEREGRVAAAAGGTLFLDEIGDLALHLQPKFLRLLEEKTYERLGESRERHADVRIIAATSRDLEADVRAGRFRKELLYRLNAVPIRVPPLRERREDVPLLLRHFLDRTDGGRWIQLADDVPNRLVQLDHPWPGNVRQLKTLAERLWLDAGDHPIGWEDVRRRLEPGGDEAAASEQPTHTGNLREAKQEFEKKKIREAIAQHPDATRAELAKKLGISRAQLHRHLRDIDPKH